MSKKSKEKKNLKSSILVLLLIAILLIASTYAWFTANRTVTISSLDVNVQAQNGLQISADAVDWKAILTKEDILGVADTYAANTNKIPTSMEPVSTDGTVESGNMNMFYGTVAPVEGTGVYSITATKETDSTTERYIVFDIFLKADEAMDLTLTSDSNVTATGVDKGLQNASRIAFINEGNVASTAGSAAAQALARGTSFSVGDRKTVIWEPNAGSHTAEAVANNPYTGVSITEGDSSAAVPYYGVKATIADPIDIKGINTDGADTQYFTKIEGAGLTSTNKGASETASFFHIDKGITKVRIYMWVEGQDVDCDNSASGTDIAFNIQFNAPEA